MFLVTMLRPCPCSRAHVPMPMLLLCPCCFRAHVAPMPMLLPCPCSHAHVDPMLVYIPSPCSFHLHVICVYHIIMFITCSCLTVCRLYPPLVLKDHINFNITTEYLKPFFSNLFPLKLNHFIMRSY